MPVYVAVTPALLHWAIQRAGWDVATTQRRAPKFDQWAAGTVRPTLNQIEKFARDTHTPLGKLFLSTPPIESIPIPDMRTIRNEAVRQPSADLLDTIYLCQTRQDWYHEYAEAYGTPKLPFDGENSLKDSPAKVAAQIRQLLRFGMDERDIFANWEEVFRTLIDRVEALGVLVMVNSIVGSNTHRKLKPTEFRGFALFDPLAPVVLG